MSKITNDGSTRSGTGCTHMATVGVKGLMNRLFKCFLLFLQCDFSSVRSQFRRWKQYGRVSSCSCTSHMRLLSCTLVLRAQASRQSPTASSSSCRRKSLYYTAACFHLQNTQTRPHHLCQFSAAAWIPNPAPPVGLGRLTFVVPVKWLTSLVGRRSPTLGVNVGVLWKWCVDCKSRSSTGNQCLSSYCWSLLCCLICFSTWLQRGLACGFSTTWSGALRSRLSETNSKKCFYISWWLGN